MKLASHELQKKAHNEKWIELSEKDLAKLHSQLLSILKDVDSICKKHGLYYSLSGGTALGAARHKGFIPWDDDADIFMTRDGFDKFLEFFDEELGDKYYLHSPERNPELGSVIVQLLKKGTVFRSIPTAASKEAGVFVDIFILENAPDFMPLRFAHGVLCDFLGQCLSCVRYYKFQKKLLEIFEGTDDEIISNIRQKAKIGKVLSLISIEDWVKITKNCYSMCKNINSRYVVCPTGIRHYFKEIFLREDYCATSNIAFEDTVLSIIKDYDRALTRLYGNYMEIPPVEKREKHTVLEFDL